MPASAGSLVVSLGLDAAQYTKGLSDAEYAARKLGHEIGTQIRSGALIAASAFAGLSAAATFAFDAVKKQADAIDAFNDLADATGASIENISALDRLARETGSTFESASSILVKFNQALGGAKFDNDAGRVLKALNLDIAELKSLDPAEALRRTAVAFQGFTQDGNTARAAQELFGKSIREAAPFLKDLAEKTELVGTTGAAAAQQAEVFNKQLFALQANATDSARAIVSNLLPALNRALQNFTDLKRLGSLGLIVKDAAKDVFGFSKLTGDNAADIKQFMRERDRLQKDFDFVSRRGLPGDDIKRRIDEVNRYLEVVRTKQRNEITGLFAGEDFSDAHSRRLNTPVPLNLPDATKGGAKKDPTAEAQRYIESLEKQLERTQELTVSEQTLRDIQMDRIGQATAAQKASALAIAKQIDAGKAIAAENKRSIDFEAQFREARLKTAEGMEKEAQSLQQGNDALRTEIALIGKNAEAQAAIEKAILSSTIAIKQQELARMSSGNILTRESAALEEQIRLLTERMELIGMKGTQQKIADDIKKTEDLANSIGAAFSSSFEKAAIEGKKFSEVLQGLAKDVAALVLRQSVTVPLSNSIAKAVSALSATDELGDLLRQRGLVEGGGGGWGSLFSSIFQGFRANGGAVEAGGLYRVNERGPELLDVDGKQFLMMGNQRGNVTANNMLGGSGSDGGVVINNYGSQKVTAERRSDGRTEVTVRELAAGMSDPSNPLSKAIERSFGLQRNR